MCAIAVIGPLAVTISANAPQIMMAFEQANFQSAWQPTSSNDVYMMMAGNIANLGNPLGEGEVIGKEFQYVAQNGENLVRDLPLLPAPKPFGNNGSIILTEENYARFGSNWGGNSGRAFVLPRADAEAMECAPNLEEINHRLGVNFSNDSNLRRVDIDNLSMYNLRMLTGGNEQWIPGGLTSGGIPERVIDPINLYDFPSKLLSFLTSKAK